MSNRVYLSMSAPLNMPESWWKVVQDAYAEDLLEQAREVHLLFCAAIGDANGVKSLLDAGVKLNKAKVTNHFWLLKPDFNAGSAETALHVACKHGQERIVYMLIDAARQQTGAIPTQVVTTKRQIETMQGQVESKQAADCIGTLNSIMRTFFFKQTLSRVFSTEPKEAAEKQKNFEAIINARSWRNNLTPLHLAGTNQGISAGCFQALIQAGADVYAKALIHVDPEFFNARAP